MTQTRIPAHGIGVAVPRREDLRLLTGRGQYAGDHFPSGLSYAAMVRAPYAHARILAIETVEALGAPGVLAVVTGADVLAAGLRPIPHNPPMQSPGHGPLGPAGQVHLLQTASARFDPVITGRTELRKPAAM